MSREPELYKDKVEVSLDGRQIFYLFFGGSVVVGIVFVLGVLVGRRVEARGHVDHAHTHTATDPLAALDRLEGNGGLSFQGALTGKDAPSSVEKTIDDIEKSRAAKPAAKSEPKAEAEKKPEPKVEAKPEPKPEAEKKPEAKKAEPEAKKAESDGPVVKPEKSDRKSDKSDSDKKSDKSDSDKKSEKKSEKKSDDSAEAKSDEPKARYTLQLSAFQDRSEAEAFLSSVKAQGFQAQITQAEVEGKGTYYRVRMGNYRSMDAANSAKSDLLEKSGKSATVMKL